jgi:hypothetical protein
VIHPFAFLLVRSGRNRLVRQLRRLRQPRYLVALALGLAYLWVMVMQQRPASAASDPARRLDRAGGRDGPRARGAWAWVFAAGDGAGFSPAG